MPKNTHRTVTTDDAPLEVPEQVTLVVAVLAGAVREGLLALAVGTGLQVLQAMLAEDVARLVGPRGRHNPDRMAVRHGSEPGRVTLGGRRVRVRRPRVRAADGSRELPVPTYQAFASTALLHSVGSRRVEASTAVQNQITRASSSNATVRRRIAGSSTASS